MQRLVMFLFFLVVLSGCPKPDTTTTEPTDTAAPADAGKADAAKPAEADAAKATDAKPD